MNLRIFYLILCVLIASVGYGQQQAPTEGIVIFDPLFWKEQLKLDDLQCRKIREINSEYYTRLYVVVREQGTRKSVQAKAAESLQQRSEEIWDTFYPKQRKRWRKMWQANYVPEKSKQT